MTPEKLAKLERWQVEAMYWSAEKCASDLSRSCAELQDKRDRLRAENERLENLRVAATNWRRELAGLEGDPCTTHALLEALAALDQKP